MIADGKQQQQSFIRLLVADAPFPVQTIGGILDRLVIQRVDSYHRKLRACCPLDSFAILLQLDTRYRIEGVSEIADKALRLQLGGIEGGSSGRRRKQSRYEAQDESEKFAWQAKAYPTVRSLRESS